MRQWQAILAVIGLGATLIGGSLLVLSYPVLSPLYPFLQPDEVSNTLYVLNRVFLIVSGLALIISAAWLTRNEERMLGSAGSS